MMPLVPAAEVWHKHTHGGADATLEVTAQGVSFADKKHEGKWSWDEIQQITLSQDELALLTYQDSKWLFGRDREFHFTDLPDGYAQSIAPSLRDHLQGRFISSLRPSGEPVWQIPARLLEHNKGTLGTLAYRPGLLSFAGGDKTRQWPIPEIENVSTSDREQFTVTTYEKYGVLHGGNRQVRFQLRAPLNPDNYQQLWREINRVQGLQILETYSK